jgi:TrmH RNA methyltransferase
MTESDRSRVKRRFVRKDKSLDRNRAGNGRKAVVHESVSEGDDAEPGRLTKISGLAAVTALFRRDPGRAVRLYYAESMKTAAGPFCATMAESRRVYRLVREDELERIAGTLHHGGIVAAARPRTVDTFDSDAAERWAAAGEHLVTLDGIGNPHNLGAIARTMAFFGMRRLLISGHHAQSGISDAAYRVAEGGLEYLETYRTPNLALSLRELKESYRVVGTVLRGGKALYPLPNDSRPICLVLGNEEEGLSPATLRACESLVTIRGCGVIQSLNVSAAAAVLLAQIAHPLHKPRLSTPAGSRGRRPNRTGGR